MQTFREWLRESKNQINENFIAYKDKIDELLRKDFPKNFKSIVAIGSTIDLQFNYPNKKEASKYSNITDIEESLNKILPVKLNKSSKEYKNGYHIESADWRKDDDTDEHSLYISFK